MPISNYDMFDIQEWNMYRDSYYFMEGHPMVKQLKKENKKLKKEIANLKTMLMITQEKSIASPSLIKYNTYYI